MSSISRTVASLFLFLATTSPALAQSTTPTPAPTPFDEAKAHLTKARALAGSDFLTTEETQCNELGEDNPYRAADKEDRIVPARIFDNLDYIGTRAVGAWVVKTSAGIILINTLHSQWTNSTLLAGFKKLGLDPADVKYVIVTDGVGELYGGAKYFQDKYGAQIIMSPAAWDDVARIGEDRGHTPTRGDSLMGGNRGGGSSGRGGGMGGGGMGGGGMGGGFGGGRGGGGRGGGGFGGGRSGGGSPRPATTASSGMKDEKPTHDHAAFTGETVTLGDESVTIYFTPAHTSGTLSVIVPVVDHGQSHVAAILGGTELPKGHDGLNDYITAATHFSEIGAGAHVDVELNSYPFVDNGIARMDTLRRATPDSHNPFVVGTDGFQRYMGVLAECGWVSLLYPQQQRQQSQ